MKTLLQHCKRSVLVLSLLFAAMLFAKQSLAQGSQTFSTAGTSSFTVPAGVTSIRVECWGGGAGGNNTTNRGGGGGAFAGNNALTVTPGSVITVTVGAGGDANNLPNTGGNSSFGSFVIANGANVENGGSGGIGTILFSGGNGGSSTSTGGAGGGGSAGAGGVGGNGGNSTNNTGGAGGTAGAAGSGTAGAVGGAGGNSGNGGIIGSAPGGGGGERASNGGSSAAGAAGRVIITWTCPAATFSYGVSSFCKSVSSGTATITGSGSGSFSSTAGLTINSLTGAINPSTSTAGTYTVHYQIASGGNGCTAVNATAVVTINTTPVTAVTGQSDISCFAGSNGSITISATGGTGPYSYSVDNNPDVNALIWVSSPTNPYVYGGLVANQAYRVRVKDSNGCISK